jgi:hypothetical protein
MSTDVDAVFRTFSTPPKSTKRRAPRLPASQWTHHQLAIEELYIRQDKTLEQVVKIMKQEHNFHATYELGPPYVTRLAD